MSNEADWNSDPEEQWFEPEESDTGIPTNRIVILVVIIAIALILIGFPIFYNPLGFVSVIAVLSVYFLMRASCNREIMRSVKGKR